MHLVDQNLNPAKPGMEILSAAGFAAKKKVDPNLKESDFLILDPHKYIRVLGSGQKGDGTGSSGRYLLHSKDGTRTNQKYGYQIYVYGNSSAYLKINGVGKD